MTTQEQEQIIGELLKRTSDISTFPIANLSAVDNLLALSGKTMRRVSASEFAPKSAAQFYTLDYVYDAAEDDYYQDNVDGCLEGKIVGNLLRMNVATPIVYLETFLPNDPDPSMFTGQDAMQFASAHEGIEFVDSDGGWCRFKPNTLWVMASGKYKGVYAANDDGALTPIVMDMSAQLADLSARLSAIENTGFLTLE